MECPKCGTQNRSDAQYCSVCNMPFAEVTPVAPSADAEAIAEENAAAAARSAAASPGTPDYRDDAATDPFLEARMEEREWYDKRRRTIEAAGGTEAYEARIRAQLDDARRAQRTRTVLVQGAVFAVGVAALAIAITYACGWGAHMAALPAASGTSGVEPAQSAQLGLAFAVTIALMAASSAIGSSVARIAKRTSWGMLAVVCVATLEAVLLVPYATAQGDGPIASGTAFGIAAFLVASLLGGSLGAAYGGRQVV